ncbi:GntR family transcriptional regulator [Colwellia sp. RSH04]|uniref:GntR family transcriptional regulator n=1 Tax=Colwellia sp. RSH04 TaxID=2305464 RepID=UPI000E57532C|nr:GntR family transcriptional regulator [Colwellia sp. RSH04]RHW74632.1 GntR family transcriptional regulator [Colwellia sp. RSH04]
MINITVGDSRPIFKQIVDELHIKIVKGDLPPGTKLPSVRGLAIQLTINTNTVAKAYKELTALGVVEAKTGLGLFTRSPERSASEKEQMQQVKQAVSHFIADIAGTNIDQETILELIENELNTLYRINDK